MRVSVRPQRAQVANLDRESQVPQIRPSGRSCRRLVTVLPQCAQPGRTTGCPASCRTWVSRIRTGGQRESPEVSASGWVSMCPASSSRNRAAPRTGIGTATSSAAFAVSASRAGTAAVKVRDRRTHRGVHPRRLLSQPGRRRGRRHSRFGLRIDVRRTAGPGPRLLTGGLADLGVDGLDLDQVVGRAVQDVAQRGQGVHRQPLGWLGDQPEHLLPRQRDAPFGQQRPQIGGLEQCPCRP